MRESTMPILIGAGEFDSRQKFHNIEISNPRKVVCYEFEYYSMDGGFSEINGIQYPMRTGNLLLGRPGDTRRSTLPFRTHFFYLSNVNGEFKQLLHSLPSVMRSNDRNQDLKTFLGIIDLFLSGTQAEELGALGEIMLLIHRMTQMKAATTFIPEDSSSEQLLTTVQRIIDSRFHENLTVDAIAQECHISTSYLHKLYASALGIGPHTALLNRRIAESRALLVKTDLAVGEIAFRCGFHSQAYFSDCFKQKTGVTPGKFRKQALYEP